MTSLRVICGLGPPQSKILATPMRTPIRFGSVPRLEFLLTAITLSVIMMISNPPGLVLETQFSLMLKHTGYMDMTTWFGAGGLLLILNKVLIIIITNNVMKQ